MKLLKEIHDENFPKNDSHIKLREASRIVAVDANGLVPLLFVSKHNYHKLPGGGIDDSENKMDALVREVSEETGCTAEVTGEIGKIIEYRSAINFDWKWDIQQISYCYGGKIVSKDTSPDFTEKELSEGFELVWLPLDKAIEAIENDTPNNFEGTFIRKRDLTFLKSFKEL